MGNPSTFQAAQKAVDDWIRTTPAGYYPEMTNLARLMEETGELARIYSRSIGGLAPKSGEDISHLALEKEMGDVLFVLICLANQAGIQLDESLARVLEKYSSRDRGRHV